MRRTLTWRKTRAPRATRLVRLLTAASLAGWATSADAQAPLAGGLPGSWFEANAFSQRVTNDFGDWSGGYARVVRPTARNTFYGEVLALRAFRSQGLQIGAAHRHDWSDRLFHVIGANIGDGAPILPRLRTDGQIGVRLGDRRQWQVVAGGSYVRSPVDLYDVAGTGAIAWFAPRMLLLEVGGRYNLSKPGDIRSHRLHGVAILTPSSRRSFSARVVGGSEGWQVVTTQTTLRRFHSTELALGWREKLTSVWALSIQGDHYTNPSYSRTGVTFGVARYW